MKHDHKICEHELKFCKECEIVYCEKCEDQWGYIQETFSQTTYPVFVTTNN